MNSGVERNARQKLRGGIARGYENARQRDKNTTKRHSNCIYSFGTVIGAVPRSLFKRDPRKVSSNVETNARRKLRGGIARGYENSGR